VEAGVLEMLDRMRGRHWRVFKGAPRTEQRPGSGLKSASEVKSEGGNSTAMDDSATNAARAPLAVILPLRTLMLAALLGGHLLELAAADPMSQSELSYRAGGDYFSFDASHGDCSISCATDARCRAYTLVLADNMCFKKDTVTPAAANSCCRSGVKLMGAMELSTDRPGSDIRSGFDSPDPPSCETACRDEPACQAYTWVRAGIQGLTAKCWLKNAEPATVSNTCCVSGVRLRLFWRVPGELVNPNLPARQ